MTYQRWVRYTALMLILGLGVAACDEGTSPTEDFDAEQAAATMNEMMTAAETEELDDAFLSLQYAGMLFQGTTALLQDPTALGAEELRVLADAPIASADVIPNEYEGSTFEWDPEQGYYVMSEATGAPTDGVRVIYYAIDPTSGLPAMPLNPLGHVDVRDLSTESANRLGVEVVRSADNVTLADYEFSLSFTYTQSSLDLDVSSAGFLSNGTDQLNFDVSQSFSATETDVTIDQAFSMDLEGTENAVSFDATVTMDQQAGEDADPESMTATATIANASQTVVLEMNWSGSALDGSVKNNGEVVVLMSGTLDDPAFTDPDGNPLTQQQRNALEGMWMTIGEMFEFVGELFSFASF